MATGRLERGNTFSLRLSQKIDSLLENHLAKNQPRELFIPGLDDGGSPRAHGGDIFDEYDRKGEGTLSRIKTAKSASQSEGTITGNVGTCQTIFNMLKVFIGIGVLATPASFKLVGILGGNIGMILIGSVAIYTMLLQIEAVKMAPTPVANYSELG